MFLIILSVQQSRHCILPYISDKMTEYYISTLSFLIIFSWATAMAEDSTQVDKRILLDDPGTVSSQMLSLQREIQTLQTKIAEIDVHQSQIQLMNA